MQVVMKSDLKWLKALCTQLKALGFLQAFVGSAEWALLSSFCDDSNLHVHHVTGFHTGEEFESISNFLIRNRFHVTLRIISPTILFK